MRESGQILTGGDLPFYLPFQGLLMWNASQLITTQVAWNKSTLWTSAARGLKIYTSTWEKGPTTSQRWRWNGTIPQVGNGKRSCIIYRNKSNSLDSDSQLFFSFFFQRSKNYAKLRSNEQLHYTITTKLLSRGPSSFISASLNYLSEKFPLISFDALSPMTMDASVFREYIESTQLWL